MTNEETAKQFAYDHLRNDGDEEAETLNCTRKQFVEDLVELLEQTRQEAASQAYEVAAMATCSCFALEEDGHTQACNTTKIRALKDSPAEKVSA